MATDTNRHRIILKNSDTNVLGKITAITINVAKIVGFLHLADIRLLLHK
jgi:hypothetical protein